MSGGAHLISCTVSPAICATHLIKIESAGVPNSTPSLHSSRLTLLLTGRSPALCAWRAPHSRSTSLHTAVPLKMVPEHPHLCKPQVQPLQADLRRVPDLASSAPMVYRRKACTLRWLRSRQRAFPLARFPDIPGSSWWGCHGFAGRGLLLGEGHLGHWHRADAERGGWPLTLGGESHGVTSAGEGEVRLDGESRLDEPISTSHRGDSALSRGETQRGRLSLSESRLSL